MRPSLRSVVWFAWGVVALLIAATAIFRAYDEPEPVARQQAASPLPPMSPAGAGMAPSAATAAPTLSSEARGVTPPSFDIVSVDRSGQAVIAGRAAPGDRVRVLDGETPIGEVRADARGEWVLVPQTPMAAGDRQLGVEAIAAKDGAVRRSPDVVALSVMPHEPAQNGRSTGGRLAGGTATLAVLLPGEPGVPARILQRPEAAAGDRKLSLDAADYGAPDRLVLSGSAEPRARLNIYAGGRLLGSATADDAGKWVLRSAYRQPAGGIELRLDQLAADGSIARRVAAPLNVPPVSLTGRDAIRDGDTYVVARGNSLWLIARRAYGQGLRYTAIYAANQDTIRDPHRIYPGQELRLPQP
ncbi:MAG: LysM peptidoglycan-binding domain-containing protein [Alphaproteobacteria bacterium]